MIENNTEFLNGRKIEDLAVAWRWSEDGGKYWFNWTADWAHWLKAKKMGCLIEYAIPAKEVLEVKKGGE